MHTLLTLLSSAALAVPATAQDLHKAHFDDIYSQLKDTARSGGTFGDARTILESKGMLGPDGQGQFEESWAQDVWNDLTKNPMSTTNGSPPAFAADVNESEPNDDTGSATPINVGDRGLGAIDPSGDFDFWSFSVASTTVLSVAVNTPDSTLDPQLTLLDSNGDAINFDDDGGPGLDSFLTQILFPGDYFCSVNGFTTSVGSYELLLTSIGGDSQTVHNREVVNASLDADSDLFIFSIPATSDVVLRTSTPYSDLDTVLSLLDENGIEITSDDDGGNGTDSTIQAQLDAGTYLVLCSSFDGTGAGNYLYENIANPVGGSASSESEPNDDFSTDNSANCCETTLGSIDPSLDIDLFTFSVGSDSSVSLAVNTPDSSLDPQVRVFDAGQNQIGFDDDGGPGLDSLLQINLAAGDYFVQVNGFDVSTGSYELDVVCSPVFSAVASESEPNDDTASANAVGAGKCYTGEIGAAGDVDLFAVSLGTATEISCSVDTPNSSLDPQVRILDDDGNELYFDDDGGPGLDSLLQGILLPAGDYFVQVNGFDVSAGSYDLCINAPFVLTAPAIAGETVSFQINGRNQDLFFLLYGMDTGSLPTKWGNQLISPATYILLLSIPPCGNIPLSLTAPSGSGGMTFYTQALVGYPPYNSGRFSNLLQVDVEGGPGQ